MRFRTEYAFLTHKGRTRKKNEDSILVSKELQLAAVADGMGGHSSGDIASKTAVRVIKTVISDIEKGNITNKNLNLDISQNLNKLLLACMQANISIINKAAKNPQDKGMGTTLSSILIRKNKAFIVHIGDSRIYLFRKNKLSQLTTDHSLINEQINRGIITREQAHNSNLQNVLTKALGIAKTPSFDTYEVKIFLDDILLLCSDGLFRTLSADNIAEILSRKNSIYTICQELIESANAKGGPDNISAILIKFNPPSLSEKIKETVKQFLK